MKILVAISLVLTFLAAGCAAGKRTVPTDAVAVVGERAISKTEFHRLLGRAKTVCARPRECAPRWRNTEEENLRGLVMLVLVERAELAQKAEELGIEVSPNECDRFVRRGLTRADVCAELIEDRIYDKVTRGIEVSEKEIEQAFVKNSPATRELRHIRVKKKALADSLYAQLERGASFPALARRYSQDRGSKVRGGKLTVYRGVMTGAFDRAAFSLATGKISRPFRSGAGWHILQPLARAKPPKLRASRAKIIREGLVLERRSNRMTAWKNAVREEFAGKTSYQVGYAPSAAILETRRAA